MLDFVFDGVKAFFAVVFSYLIAIFRLLFFLVIFLFSGLQQIIFTRSEVCDINMKTIPLWCDRENILNNLSYIDKLSIENPGLVEPPEDIGDLDDLDEGNENS